MGAWGSVLLAGYGGESREVFCPHGALGMGLPVISVNGDGKQSAEAERRNRARLASMPRAP